MTKQPAFVAIQFWTLAALYCSECHWVAWLNNRDSRSARRRRYANAARARALVVYDRALNQEDRND